MFNPSSPKYSKPDNLGFEADPEVHALPLETVRRLPLHVLYLGHADQNPLCAQIQTFLASYLKDNKEMTNLLMLSEADWSEASKTSANKLKSSGGKVEEEDDEDDEDDVDPKSKAKGKGAKDKKRTAESDDDGDDESAKGKGKGAIGKGKGKASKGNRKGKASKGKGKKRAIDSDSSWSSSDEENAPPPRKKPKKDPLRMSSAHNSDAA